jgi:hypothetical protein
MRTFCIATKAVWGGFRAERGYAAPEAATVLSAGPDGIIQTLFEVDGIEPHGDDVIALVSSGG